MANFQAKLNTPRGTVVVEVNNAAEWPYMTLRPAEGNGVDEKGWPVNRYPVSDEMWATAKSQAIEAGIEVKE